MVTVKFSDVGPRKLAWTAEMVEPLSFRALMHEVKKRRALGSRDLLFDFDCRRIFAGFRSVGVVEIVEPGEDR